jgi:hypothetical protein
MSALRLCSPLGGTAGEVTPDRLIAWSNASLSLLLQPEEMDRTVCA